MSQMLNLARAAHLVGVPRGVLQRMISSGEIASFDGLIAVTELQRAFPSAALEDSGAFEQVRTIREEAFGRRLRERVLPSPEVLAQRLFAQSQELADLRRLCVLCLSVVNFCILVFGWLRCICKRMRYNHAC